MKKDTETLYFTTVPANQFHLSPQILIQPDSPPFYLQAQMEDTTATTLPD